MSNNLTTLAAAFLLLGGLFFSCQKTDFDNLTVAEHESEWAAPLFHTSIGIEDLLQKTLVDTAAKLLIGADGSLTFYYQGDVAEKFATELDEKFKQLPGVGVVYPQTDTTVALPSPDKLRIRKVLLKSGFMIPSVYQVFPTTGPITVEVKIDQLLRPDGQPFVHTFTVPTGTSGIWGAPDSIFVDNFKIDAPKDSFSFRYKAWDEFGDAVYFPFCGLAMQEFKFKYAEGFWESTTYPLHKDTIPIDIYKFVAGDGKIQFDNPRLTAFILNSFGFPTRAKINTLRIVLKNGDFVPFTGTAIDNGINAEYPKLNEVGQVDTTTFYFDQFNSNIKDIFNSQPVALEYDIEGISNPDNDPDFVGFITDASFVRLRMRVELPLRASAQDFVIQDTLDLNFGSYGSGGSISTDKIVEAEFKLVAENRMPVALETQIIFLDHNGQAIDSLFSNGPQVLMDAAPVDANGFVVSKSVKVTTFLMDAIRFDRVRTAEKAVMRSRFNTSGGGTQPVTAQANQKTDIRMGLKVKLR